MYFFLNEFQLGLLAFMSFQYKDTSRLINTMVRLVDICNYSELDIIVFNSFLITIKQKTEFRPCFTDIFSCFAFFFKKQIYYIWTVTSEETRLDHSLHPRWRNNIIDDNMLTNLVSGFITRYISFVSGWFCS